MNDALANTGNILAIAAIVAVASLAILFVLATPEKADRNRKTDQPLRRFIIKRRNRT